MRGFVLFSIFAMFYVLIIILLQVSCQSVVTNSVDPEEPVSVPPGISTTQNTGSNTNQNPSVSGFPVADNFFGIHFRPILTTIYGTLMGKAECVKKSLCFIGNFFHTSSLNTFFLFTMVDNYVPAEWKPYYISFRDAIMNERNCNDFYQCPSVAAPH